MARVGFVRLPTNRSVSWPMEEELVVARFPFVLGLSFPQLWKRWPIASSNPRVHSLAVVVFALK